LGTRARKLLWILAVGFLLDLAFIQLDRMYLQGRLDERFSLDNEAGYAETYQNSKELVLAVLAGAYLLRRKDRLYLCWFAILTYIFLDDTFQLHETLGEWISAHTAIPAAFGLRSVDFGELIVSGSAGLASCVSLLTSWRRSAADARRLSWILLFLLLSLAFFGVFLDMLHVLTRGATQYRLGITEDGGEMLVITVLLWVVAIHFPARATADRS
jgi:hypothetical protein